MKRMKFVEMLAMAIVFSVLSLNASGSTFQVIYNFTGGQDGAAPVDAGNLAIDANGNLYGTTEFGGACGQGTLFELSPNGGGWTETVLHSFCGVDNDGLLPSAAPVYFPITAFGPALDGNAAYGGEMGGGVNYQFDFNQLGYEATIYSECASGCIPYAGSAGFPFGGPGVWYSPQFTGGTNGGGALNGGGYNFCSLPGCSDGANPGSGVAVDGQDDAYGTTRSGGTANQGVIYECAANANGCIESVLHSFAGGLNDGAYPFLATPLLTQACGPNLCTQTIWGTTPLGGAYGEVIGGYGTVWSINQLAGFNLLHSFDRIDGAWPYAGLTNLNGTFYGTTSGGGPFQQQCCPPRVKAGRGTIYSLTSSGTLTTLHTFTGFDGALPYSGLVADTSGNLYGVTFSGGTYNAGVVYEITP
jgi:uncharacterized repeat protein (TIGR03803 family)